jgi:hypothetical protein
MYSSSQYSYMHSFLSQMLLQKILLLNSIIFLSIVSFIGCEINTRVTVDGNNPPTFKLSGTGGIYFLRVVELSSQEQSVSDGTILWEIKPDPELHGTAASQLPPITYGKVPSGFTQTKPGNGPPPSLVEGKLYDAWAPTYNANGGGIMFIIKDKRSVGVTD